MKGLPYSNGYSDWQKSEEGLWKCSCTGTDDKNAEQNVE